MSPHGVLCQASHMIKILVTILIKRHQGAAAPPPPRYRDTAPARKHWPPFKGARAPYPHPATATPHRMASTTIARGPAVPRAQVPTSEARLARAPQTPRSPHQRQAQPTSHDMRVAEIKRTMRPTPYPILRSDAANPTPQAYTYGRLAEPEAQGARNDSCLSSPTTTSLFPFFLFFFFLFSLPGGQASAPKAPMPGPQGGEREKRKK